MLILLSNDDGIDAPGLRALAAALGPLGELVVVAPEREQSASSHALTMWEPLRVQDRGAGWFAVNGTPADCAYLGVHHLCGRLPDVVVSGVNRGANLGEDVHYSGTVAAAMEAVLHGVPGLAVSLFTDFRRPIEEHHFDTAAVVAVEVVEHMMRDGIPADTLLNLNVPDVPMDKLLGLRCAPLGRRRYFPMVDQKTDPRGMHYYWIGGPPMAFGGAPDADGHLVAKGYATLTPMHPDMTARDALDRIRAWDR